MFNRTRSSRRSLKSTAATAIMALVMSSTAMSAVACTRYIAQTDHGAIVMRSVDWGEKLGAVGHVHPVGEARRTSDVDQYGKAAEWSVKYHTVAMEEHELFHGASVEAINDQGLSAMGLYQNNSKPFNELHSDKGFPAVSLSDFTAFVAENYATVAEVLEAHEKGEFQIAWGSKMRGSDTFHGVHFSVVDKSGDIALFQLNEGGTEVVHIGDAASDLRVMTNSPLQQDHREYIEQFDLSNNRLGADLPSTIGSLDRNLRLLWSSQYQDYSGKSYDQTMGQIQMAFDNAVLVPHGIEDPADNGSSATYATWISFRYNLDNGEITTRSLETAKEITFTLEDTKAFGGPVCADLIQQADSGKATVTWGSCDGAAS